MKIKYMFISFIMLSIFVLAGCDYKASTDNLPNVNNVNEPSIDDEANTPNSDTNQSDSNNVSSNDNSEADSNESNDNKTQTDSNDNKTESPSTEEVEEDNIDYLNSIFVSPNGNGNGTYENPYSLENGISNLSNNKILYILGGVYIVKSVIKLQESSNNNSYFKIYAFKNERVILDFGKDYRKEEILNGLYNTESAKGIVVKGSYYHIKGLTITNCGASGMQISGNYNIIENCVFSYNGNTGCSIAGSSKKSFNEWPHDNLIKNCTSYGNYDWDRLDNMQGEDADGFGCKLTSGNNNVFDGCIAYNNSDDGWDLFTKHITGAIGPVTIKNSVAFSNGYSTTGESLKNGQGFKLGGRAIEVSHKVENCVAFYNKSNGFDDNSNPGSISLKKCTSFENGNRNYAMGRFLEENNTYTSTWYENNILFGPIENVPKSHNIYEDCLSYDGGITDSYSGTAKNCYFYSTNKKYILFNDLQNCNSKYLVGKEADLFNPFVNTDINLDNLDNIHYDYRNTDYSVNLKAFLKLKDDFSIGANLN